MTIAVRATTVGPNIRRKRTVNATQKRADARSALATTITPVMGKALFTRNGAAESAIEETILVIVSTVGKATTTTENIGKATNLVDTIDEKSTENAPTAKKIERNNRQAKDPSQK